MTPHERTARKIVDEHVVGELLDPEACAVAITAALDRVAEEKDQEITGLREDLVAYYDSLTPLQLDCERPWGEAMTDLEAKAREIVSGWMSRRGDLADWLMDRLHVVVWRELEADFATALSALAEAKDTEIAARDQEQARLLDLHDALRARVATLERVARGQVRHVYQGDCPDEHHPERVCPECPACAVLVEGETKP